MKIKTRSQARARLRQIEKDFPGHKGAVQGTVACMPDSDIASLREARDEGRAEVDTSNMRWMLPFNRRKIAREYASAAGERLNWRTNAADYQLYERLIRGSFTDRQLSHELAQYRNFEITSDILATPFALGAFQSINLSADELPQIITPKARQYFNVRYIGQDGGARQDAWRTARSAENFEMRLLSTDKIEYPLMDLQQGNVNEVSTINAQLRYDMEMKIDTEALTSLDNNQMNSGIKALLNIHPQIDQSNLPDENYLDLTDTATYGPAQVFTIARLKAILFQMAKWGFGFDPDGPIQIQSMIMSPLHARDSWDYIDLVSGFDSSGETWNVNGTNRAGRPSDDPNQMVTTQMREEIMRTGGMLQSGWGYNWTTQYQPRLAAGKIYVFTNQPVGWYFTKSEWDQVIEWKDQPDYVEQNMAAILMRRSLQFVQPELWAYRYLIVDF